MKNELYIIGNGFDLHHGLKTSYYDFATYLENYDKNLYDTLETYIGYPETEENLWSRFEENLANLNVEEILSENSDYLPNIASDEFRDRDLHTFPDVMQETFENLTINLLEQEASFWESSIQTKSIAIKSI